MVEVAQLVQYVAVASAPVLVFLASFAMVRARRSGDGDAGEVRHGAWVFGALALIVLAVAFGGEHVPAPVPGAMVVVGLAGGIAVGRQAARSDS